MIGRTVVFGIEHQNNLKRSVALRVNGVLGEERTSNAGPSLHTPFIAGPDGR